jgi:FkbM family methyltransferase
MGTKISLRVLYFAERTRTMLFRVFGFVVTKLGRIGLGRRLPVLRRIYFGVSALLRPGVVSVGRWKVYFHRGDNAVSHGLRNDSTYEPFELNLISLLLAPGSCAVDVGANIGLHTLAMSEACGPTGRVLALEPEPDNIRLWRRNMEANGCQNVELLSMAASDRTETLELFLNEANRGDHRVYDPGGERSSVQVPAGRLDEVLSEKQLRPSLLKIDVQGWEPKVLAGARPSLEGTYPLAVLTEFWTEGLTTAGSSAADYVAQLDALNLDLYEIDEERRCLHPVPADRATLLDTQRETNLLGVRGIDMASYPLSAAAER